MFNIFGIIFLALLGLSMICVYARTRKPKRFAVLNSAAGLISLAAVQLLNAGTVCFSAGSAGLSAILGVPGAVLYIILERLI